MRNTILVLAAFCVLSASSYGQNVKKESLITPFFEGWRTLGGNALYRMEEGETPVIVGEATLNTPNTFLATEKEYGDFILDFEVKVDSPLNSGVQIRSHSLPAYNDGQVHGYQVEIDPSTRAWSGGIYEEGRRGWLYPLTQSESARKAFRNGKWNQYHIEAIGPSVRTWINGVQCANLLDTDSEPGFIALQVHGIGNDTALAGKTVRWRNISLQTGALETLRWQQQAQAAELNLVPGRLSAAEMASGWRSIQLDSLNSAEIPGNNYEIAFDFQFGETEQGVIRFPMAYPGAAGCARMRIELNMVAGRSSGLIGVQKNNYPFFKAPALRGHQAANRLRLRVNGSAASVWINEQLVGEQLFQPEWWEFPDSCGVLVVEDLEVGDLRVRGL